MTTPFQPAGVPVTNRFVFNSGQIDFGNSRVVAIDSITLSADWTDLILYIMNSVKGADIVRHSLKCMLTGKLKSYPLEMDMIAAGSSALGTPDNAVTLDGQPTLSNPVVTLFDRNGKQVQYQFANALFKSTKFTGKAEDYGQWDFEMTSLDVVEVATV
jgi:hypothetical protein